MWSKSDKRTNSSQTLQRNGRYPDKEELVDTQEVSDCIFKTDQRETPISSKEMTCTTEHGDRFIHQTWEVADEL